MLGLWHAPKRMIRVYKRIDPFVRLFVACWIAAEHTHLVLLNSRGQRTSQSRPSGTTRQATCGARCTAPTHRACASQTPPRHFTAVESTDPDSLWLPPAFNPWLWCLGDAAAPIAWIQDVFLRSAGSMGYFRPTTREEGGDTAALVGRDGGSARQEALPVLLAE